MKGKRGGEGKKEDRGRMTQRPEHAQLPSRNLFSTTFPAGRGKAKTKKLHGTGKKKRGEKEIAARTALRVARCLSAYGLRSLCSVSLNWPRADGEKEGRKEKKDHR